MGNETRNERGCSKVRIGTRVENWCLAEQNQRKLEAKFTPSYVGSLFQRLAAPLSQETDF